MNIDEVPPSPCHGCVLQDEDKIEVNHGFLIKPCRECMDRIAYVTYTTKYGYCHDAMCESIFVSQLPEVYHVD